MIGGIYNITQVEGYVMKTPLWPH